VATRAYDLSYHGIWSIDLASVDRAWTPRTRAVVLVSPNNPTGSFVRQAELEPIASLCVRSDAAIIADEVFADYEVEPGSAAGAARVLDRSDVLAFSLGGLSKSAGLPQVKLGWIATAGPETLVRQALERLELIADTYLSVSTPVQVAAGELIARGANIRQQILERIRSNYRSAKQIVSAMPASEIFPTEGGWSVVVRVPTFASEEDLVLSLLEREGVLAHPGYFFDFPNESHIVVSLLAVPGEFDHGLRRIMRHLDCTVGEP
jgi:aspartate/methionine/tyrosine aminotransferase